MFSTNVQSLSEQRFLLRILEQNPASIVITDADGNITYVNQRFSEISGYSYNEVIGKNPRIFKAPESHTDYRNMWDALTRGEHWRGELHNRKKNGELYWEHAWISPILDDSGTISHYLAIKDDITMGKEVEAELEKTVAQATQMACSLEFQNAEIEQQRQELDKIYTDLKAAQSQIVQGEKMASIGQLAAGVAHEINNPMGFISSNLRSLAKYTKKLIDYISLMERAPNEGISDEDIKAERKKLNLDFLIEDIVDLIAESLDGADRVKNIVQNLKTFSRIDQAEEQLIDINACLDSTIAIVWNEIKYKAELQKNYAQVPKILCNPQELAQVFTNILVNAAQAIEAEGVITIDSNFTLDQVIITISDNGCGIEEKNQKKIFEPFFTTKEVGKGTGLGMSISYDIIKKHKGDIRVSSQVGHGTTFTIELPINQKENDNG
jgi:two-component system NtrC family sensor kinase